MKVRFNSAIPTLFLFAAFILIACSASSQELNLRTFNYHKADSIALNFPKSKYKTYNEVVEPLTINLETEQEKFRAIYRWIADNVSYSFSNKSDDPGRALTKRKAVCAGYSSLLKQMCNLAGIECNVIDGWAKNSPEDIMPSNEDTRHAWNEVNLNGKWYLTDITWASGTYDYKRRKFYKNFDSAYFLPSPEFFIKQHFPLDKKMQMLDTLTKKSSFTKSCVWYKDADRYGVSVLSPKKGVINQNVKKDLTFTVLIKNPIINTDSLQHFNFIIADGDKSYMLERSTKSIIRGNKPDQYFVTVQCRFPEELKGEHNVDLYYNGYGVSGFRINFH